MNKTNLLSQIDLDKLREIALLTQNIPKYNVLSKPKSELTFYLSNKFSLDQLHFILRGLIRGDNVGKIANEIKERNGVELGKLFIKQLKNPFSFKREINVGNRIADLAYLTQDGELVAIEIKANGDKLQKAILQCNDYRKWADFVYLLIESKKIKELEKIENQFDRNVGFIIFNKNNFLTRRIAKKNDVSISYILELIPLRALKQLAKKYGIKTGKSKFKVIENIRNSCSQTNLSHGARNMEFDIKNSLLK